jgi:hypothetical protein
MNRGRRFSLIFLGAWCAVLSAQAQFSDGVIERGKAATVQILSLDSSGKIEGTGSGFFISEQGHVATNFHVIEGGAGFLVAFSTADRLFVAPATVVARSAENDLAILKTRKFAAAIVCTLAIGQPSSGQRVMAIGFPGILDYLPSSSQGLTEVRPGELKGDVATLAAYAPATFSGEVGKMLGIDYVAHSAKISEGNSGGPLIDVEGRVVGINTLVLQKKVGVTTDYSVAVHASHLADLAQFHNIRLKTSLSRATAPGDFGRLPLLLIAAVGALSIITFVLMLRRPRVALVEGMSRLIGRSQRESPGPAKQQDQRSSDGAMNAHQRPPSSRGTQMTLRGRDQEGQSFRLDFDDQTFQRHGGRLIIGRNRDLSQLHLPQDSVSRQHAVLQWRDGTIWVEDRNSGNGTQVNRRELTLGAAAVPLKAGDRLKLGEVELIFDILR